MDYSQILSISGKTGLFKLVATTKTGGIVESLIDGKRIPTFSADRISSIEDISVFTIEDNLPLKEVFKTIFEKESGKKILDGKSPEKELKDYFTSIVPNWDADRVYVSDIRKIISWYNLLQEKSMLVFEDEKTEESDSAAEAGEKSKAAPKEKQAAKGTRSSSNVNKSSSKNSAATTKAKSKQTVMKKTTPQSKAK